MPTEMEEYLFDLNGFLVIRNAVDGDHVEELNACTDALFPLEAGDWKGHVHFTGGLQNIYEAGEPLERLIDQPSYIEHVDRFVGGDDGLFIDEGS